MANTSKAKAEAALQKAGIPRKSFSILEFCGRHGLSEGFYRDMRKKGKMPRETRIGDRILISEADEAAWLKKHSKASA
jgi:hypothetical protein